MLAAVLSVAIVLSAVALIVGWGIPYIEYQRVKEGRERASLQFDTLNTILDAMAYQKSGVTSTISLSVDRYSMVYGEKDADRLVIAYSLDKGYNFSVTNLDPTSPGYNDTNFTVIMQNGEVTKARVYWLKEDMDSYSPCFSPETLVLMKGGYYKPISKIRVGDEVMGYDFEEKKIKNGTVTRVIISRVNFILTINNCLRTTTNHLFYTREGWIYAENLTGKELFTPSGDWLPVFSVKKEENTSPVYGLEVSDCHNFFVLLGKTPVLVHNQLVPPLTCSLTANPTSGNAPLTVTFTININGGTGSGNWALDCNGDGTPEVFGEYDSVPFIRVETYTYINEGTYTATLSVRDNKGKTCTDSVNINVGEAPKPRPKLEFSPKSHDFGGMKKGEVKQTVFYIWNDGKAGSQLNFSLSSSQPWITFYPDNGSSAGSTDKVEITVTVNTSKLFKGVEYNGAIHISSNGGDGYFVVSLVVLKMPITPLEPRVGESFRVGSTLYIRWINTTTVGSEVNISLCDAKSGDPLPSINPIGSNIPTSNHHYEWQIPLSLIPVATHSLHVIVNISDGRGNFGYSSPFFILERFDGIYQNETVTPTKVGNVYTFDTSYPLNGSVAIELYNSSLLIGMIWIFDSDAIIYEITTSIGEHKVVAEFGGILYYENGKSTLYKPFSLTLTNSSFTIILDQLKVAPGSSQMGGANVKITSYLGVASQREERKVYNISIEFYGKYADAWNEYIDRKYSSLISYHGDGLRFLLQHATVKFEIGL